MNAFIYESATPSFHCCVHTFENCVDGIAVEDSTLLCDAICFIVKKIQDYGENYFFICILASFLFLNDYFSNDSYHILNFMFIQSYENTKWYGLYWLINWCLNAYIINVVVCKYFYSIWILVFVRINKYFSKEEK